MSDTEPEILKEPVVHSREIHISLREIFEKNKAKNEETIISDQE